VLLDRKYGVLWQGGSRPGPIPERADGRDSQASSSIPWRIFRSGGRVQRKELWKIELVEKTRADRWRHGTEQEDGHVPSLRRCSIPTFVPHSESGLDLPTCTEPNYHSQSRPQHSQPIHSSPLVKLATPRSDTMTLSSRRRPRM
jgi:hypothetical protein